MGCVAVDTSGDWVVCGGSMAPTFFHLSSSSSATMTSTTKLPPGAVTQTAVFVSDRVRYCMGQGVVSDRVRCV